MAGNKEKKLREPQEGDDDFYIDANQYLDEKFRIVDKKDAIYTRRLVMKNGNSVIVTSVIPAKLYKPGKDGNPVAVVETNALK